MVKGVWVRAAHKQETNSTMPLNCIRATYLEGIRLAAKGGLDQGIFAFLRGHIVRYSIVGVHEN